MKSIPPVGTKVTLTGLYREPIWLAEYEDSTGVVTKISLDKSVGMHWVEVEFDGEGSPGHRTHGVFICNLSLTTLIRRP